MEDVSSAAGQQPEPMYLQTETTHTDDLGELVGALAQAQLEFETVVKDTKNPYYNSKYADLAGIIAATQKPLAKQGLVIIQYPQVDVEGQRVTLISKLAHKSNQWIENRLTLPAIMQGKDGKPRFDAQSCGSAMTYARRYAYQALVGVAAEVDDDANQATGMGTTARAQEVAAEKMQAREKQGSKAIPCMYYIWHDESQTAEITGADEIKTANKDVLKPLYNASSKTIVANAEQLEALKYEFEKRNVLFRPLKENRA